MKAQNCEDRKRLLADNEGFSLVELIIVVAIMAVLIATLAPQYTKYVERARVQSDLTALSELKQAIVLACIDPVNTDIPVSVHVSNAGNISFYNASGSYTPNATAGIKDDIDVVIGSKIPFTSATAKAQTLDYIISIENDAGIMSFQQNWDVSGKTA